MEYKIQPIDIDPEVATSALVPIAMPLVPAITEALFPMTTRPFASVVIALPPILTFPAIVLVPSKFKNGPPEIDVAERPLSVISLPKNPDILAKLPGVEIELVRVTTSDAV